MAVKYLEKKNYKVLQRNWTNRWAEIDLICRKEGKLVFIEVKYRSSLMFGYGGDAITWKKRNSLHRSISSYLMINNIDLPWRLDVISILRTGRGLKLKHYKSITS